MKSQINENQKDDHLHLNKKVSRIAAFFLGCTSCVAQASKCPFENDNADSVNDSSESSQTIETNTETANKSSGTLSFLQDLDKIYFL
ncbi:MAG TPA: hypothetical protein VK528_08470 [Flavobacterium sp.]|nr:hypothetical protein [Flavobacterium sp.]